MSQFRAILLTTLTGVLGFGQATSLNAQSFALNGLRYTVLSGEEVSVAYNEEDTVFLTGRVVIPSQVTNPENQRAYQVTALADTAFKRCDLIESLVLPASLKQVGFGVVEHCFNLSSFEMEAGAQNFTTVDGVLFNSDVTTLVCCPPAKSGSYTVPATVNTLASGAFATCKNFDEVILPEGLKEIPDYAFLECWALYHVVFPVSLESIGNYAFDGTIIQFLLFQRNLKHIGDHAFERSSMVECMLLGSTPPELGVDVFGNDMKYTRLYVPAGASRKYNATRWSIFPTIYEGNKTRRWEGSYR